MTIRKAIPIKTMIFQVFISISLVDAASNLTVFRERKVHCLSPAHKFLLFFEEGSQILPINGMGIISFSFQNLNFAFKSSIRGNSRYSVVDVPMSLIA